MSQWIRVDGFSREKKLRQIQMKPVAKKYRYKQTHTHIHIFLQWMRYKWRKPRFYQWLYIIIYWKWTHLFLSFSFWVSHFLFSVTKRCIETLFVMQIKLYGCCWSVFFRSPNLDYGYEKKPWSSVWRKHKIPILWYWCGYCMCDWCKISYSFDLWHMRLANILHQRNREKNPTVRFPYP